ncbi:MAG: VPLPA-CTERM-specific exosortase XrtD [Gammaproteobacteria bacterium]
MTTVTGRAAPATGIPLVPVLLAVALCSLVLLFRDSLGLMVGSWWSLKHSHGFLIPWLVIALLVVRSGAGLDARPSADMGAWIGLLLLFASAALLVFGELAAVYTLSQFGFVVALWGLLLSATGFRYLRLLWLPLLCLLFMVPLPQFLSNNLIALLQLLAAQLGTLLIRTAGFAVVLEGNLVDVGVYRIPVVEACSSVLIFLALLSIAFPAAVLYRGRWWWRLLLLSLALLIPVLAGSLRIATTGLLARYRGVAAADGFLQATGGAPLYLTCIALLLLLIWWLGRRLKQTVASAYGLALPVQSSGQILWFAQPGAPLWAALILVAGMTLVSGLVTRPELKLPERQRFAFFPRQLGDWEGRTAAVDPAALASLKLADHLSLVYQRSADPMPVSLWVAWYDVQVYGASIHSPMACLPGAGWRIETLSTYSVPVATRGDTLLRVNRAIIALGTERQLVYYWFAQRGRELTNEYLLKWYIFQDGLLMQRSDGALIRLSTPLPDVADISEADARLTALVQAITPVLGDYVPGAEARPRSRLLNKP